MAARGRRNTWCELNPNDLPVSGKKKEISFPLRRTSADTDATLASPKTSNLFPRRFRCTGSSKELRVSRGFSPVIENEAPSSDSTDLTSGNLFLWELPLAAFAAHSEHLFKQQTLSITQNGSNYPNSMAPRKDSSNCNPRRGSFAPLMGHQFSFNAGTSGGNSGPIDINSSQSLSCNSVDGNSNISSLAPEEDKPGTARTKARLQNLFNGKDKDTMDKMKELLDLLSYGGFESEFNFPSQQFLKESNWYELSVGSEEDEDLTQSKMTKPEKDYQEAVWELLKSELLYMEKLKVLSDVFLTTLEEIQKEGILVEVSIERLFGNLRAVCQAHLTFWLDHLQPVLETARENKQLINAIDICDAFLQIETLFEPHMTYIKDQESCTQYARSTYQTNEFFKVFVMWCESQKVCGRLKLTDLLVKPMQRLAQYPLLLQAILKNSSHEEEQCALKQALSCAQQFLAQVNSTLRLFSEQEKVFILNERLEAFDFFDFQNEDLCQAVEKYSKFDIISPPLGISPSNGGNGNGNSAMRKLLVEGPWRLKESSKGKMDVYAYLFVDVLIVTKHAGSRKGGASGGIPKLKPIHPPMGLSQLVVTPVSSPGPDPLQGSYNNNRNGISCTQGPSISTGSFTVVYLNECNVAMSAFLVNVGSPSNAHVWIAGINNAKKQFVPPVLSLESRNSFTTTAPSTSSYSIDSSPNQRMSSKIANQIRTLFSPTALSTEDEDDVTNAHSSANNLYMTPVNHFRTGSGSSPQRIARNQRSMKKTSCEFLDVAASPVCGSPGTQ